MSKDLNLSNIPCVLQTLLNDTYIENQITGENYSHSLLSVLKKNHYWPALQIKKFYNNNNMILLHNTYKRNDIIEFQELYDLCRSVILDFSLENNIVITYANSIINRISDFEYDESFIDSDLCEIAYDSTMISVYYHIDKWYFGTTSCPSVDSSKFTHPTKKHGTMFNEVLYKLFPTISDNTPDGRYIRENFTNFLNKEFVYEFALVHFENTKFVDYTKELGEKYKDLFHISTKKKGAQIISNHTYILDHQNNDLSSIGIKYVKIFDNPLTALSELRERDNEIFGIIVTRNNIKIYKVSMNMMIFKEETDPGNPNPWRNMIWIYQQNREDFHIIDYIKTYKQELSFPLDNLNKSMDPTYIIHTVFSTMKDIFYNLYITTTQYYPKYNRFKMDKDLDKKLPPILQFHLSQLRYKQITTYKDTKMILSSNIVFHYLCHSNNIKNIISLVDFFSTNSGYDLTNRQSLCFSILSSLLH
jgi:hypothetical protein